jgi:hypothetical protein
MSVLNQKKKKQDRKRERSKTKEEKRFDKERSKYDDKDSISLKKHGEWYKMKMSFKSLFRREKT